MSKTRINVVKRFIVNKGQIRSLVQESEKKVKEGKYIVKGHQRHHPYADKIKFKYLKKSNESPNAEINDEQKPSNYNAD